MIGQVILRAGSLLTKVFTPVLVASYDNFSYLKVALKGHLNNKLAANKAHHLVIIVCQS